MAYAAIDDPMAPAVAVPCNLIGGGELAALATRSDWRGGLRLLAHLGCMTGTGLVVWLALPSWYLLLPAMVLHGVTIVTLFAPMHECVHRTAFASRSANLVVGWLAGVLSFYNFTFYRHFHAWHHRYTQDPQRDPELIYPKAQSRRDYLVEVSGAMFWLRRAIDYPRLACGRIGGLPFVTANARGAIALSMSLQLAVYLAAVIAVTLGSHAILYFWLLPVVLAQPFLRALLICEHSGCSLDQNGLSNTRTTLASRPVRLLMWNMPFHAEHHLYPTIPFHQLPALHAAIGNRLKHVAPGYPAAHAAILDSLPRRAEEQSPRWQS